MDRNKKLVLKRETVKTLSVHSGVRTGTFFGSPVYNGGPIIGPGPTHPISPSPGGGGGIIVQPPPVVVGGGYIFGG